MVFSSTIFLTVFLPIVLAVSALAPSRRRNGVLLASSLVFYVWGGGPAIVVLGFTMLISFRGAQLLVANPSRQIARSVITLTLLPLILFKYAAFASEILTSPLRLVGLDVGALPEQTLPVGISFFTFQAVSYVLDVWRSGEEPLDHPGRYALYIALFPQLVAGPIVRYSEIREQLYDRRMTVAGVATGAVRFSHGLVKKVVVADSVGAIADAVFGSNIDRPTAVVWMGVLAYTIQIYFDFSGYSDMAIGLGRMFGFRFPENFERPYSSVTITEFWRRWHITLSSWFRDYVYIPLGGSRGSRAMQYRNLMVVFVLTALWHGAAFTFLVWGGIHGAWLIFERASGLRDTNRFVVGRRVMTMAIVMVSWVFFRAESLAHAGEMLSEMFRLAGGPTDPAVVAVLTLPNVAMLVIGTASLLLPKTWVTGPRLVALGGRDAGRAAQVVHLGAMLSLGLLFVAASDFSPFLYFQF